MSIDDVVIHFNENQIVLLNFCLAYIMFGVALELSVRDFTDIWKNKKSTFAGLLSQMVLLPLMTVLLIWLIKPYPSLALGMLLISVCPGGNVSNYAVHLSKGNTALSVVMTAISTIASALHTPFTFLLIYMMLPKEMQGQYNSFSIPFWDMAGTVFMLMIIPLILGIFVQIKYSAIQKMILPVIKKSSILLFIIIIISGIYSNLGSIHLHLDKVFFVVLIHNSAALLLGYTTSKLFKLQDKDTRSITIETGIQNSGLALVLIFNFFNGLGGMALIAAWWSIWHLISSLTVALYWRSNNNKKFT